MKRVGIRDVAQRAGVSMSSVSNALNKPDRVSADIVQRVRAAVDELGYVPLQAAQQLRVGRSGLLGMTVINITNPFFGDLVNGAEDAAGSSGTRVLVGNSDDDEKKEREYFQLFKRVQVEGALISPFGEAGEILARELARSMPVVLVDRVDDEGILDSVSFDDVAGGRLAAEHLISLGRTRLAFLGAREEVRQVRERLTGVRQAVEAHPGVSLELMWSQRTTSERGVEMGARIAELAELDRPDGIITTNDHLACGVVHGLLRAGIRVPHDVAVVGYDDIEFAAVAAVPLTSVRQPARAMGRAAGLRLMQLVSGEAVASGHAIRFDPELTVRASTIGYS
jgi:LacI family transcriptional regulator